MAKPILLTCNVPAKRAAKLRAAAVRMGIRVHAVEKWEYLNPVGSFTGDCGSFESMYDGEGFRDELLVLAHFPQSLFTAFLQQLRAMSLSIPLKCVLTEQNCGWNLLELHAHLCEERDTAKRGETAHETPVEEQNAES